MTPHPSHNNKRPLMHDVIVGKKAPQNTSEHQGAHIPIRRVVKEQPKAPPMSESIGNIPVPIPRADVHTAKADSFFTRMKEEHRHEPLRLKEQPKEYTHIVGTSHTGRRWYLRRPFFILYGVLAFTLFLVFVDLLSGVTVAITPHQEFFNIDTLVKFSGNGGGVETIQLEETIQGTAETHGEKDVEEKSSGKIVIYNAFSSEPQVLVRRTRFETPDGKTYRIPEQITVPGAVITDGKVQPSSIEVVVQADEPGEEYNIGLSDFTIPGFKGSPRYEKFYARSVEPMTGGFKGKARVVAESDALELSSSLHTQLSEELKRRATSELPENLFIPAGASQMNVITKDFSADVGKPADTFSLDLSLRFDGLAVSFEHIEKQIITKYLAKDGVDPNTFDVVNVRELSYSAEDVDSKTGAMTLRIQGLAHIAWHIDYNEIASALAQAGYRKQMNVFLRYPSIEEAAVSFFPSWWRIFPNSIEKIIVERTLFDSPQHQ
ncbi:MAG: hypothetical protein Q8O83_05340 [bacterium]|nr:hypothetical protein [bacterium]